MADANTLKPTLATTNPDGTETQKVVPIDSGNAPSNGQPTTPGTAAGSLKNTTLDRMNNSLSHVCDFSLEVQKNNALRLFLVAQAKNIREGVRAIMKALGFSDSTGQYQWLFDRMKDITRALKWLQRNVIQPILDFEKYVVDYIKKIQEIIAWILTLPAKLLAVLKDCLAKLYKLISNLMTAVASDLSEAGTGETGFSDVVSAAKEAATTALQTANAAAQAAAGAVAIATVASALPNLVSPLKKGV
jgi:dihydroxyacetone kinase-like predicted kinase